MRSRFGKWTALLFALLCAPVGLFGASGGAGASEILYGTGQLPAAVARMWDAIRDATRTGEVEEMRPVLESNELLPLVSQGPVDDVIGHWRRVSGDGHGREILAIMSEILEAGYVRLKPGKPDEIYVWPYFAEVPLDTLTGAQEVELYRLVSPAEVKTMRAQGKYRHYRLGIGRDGTWHYMLKDD